MAQVKPAVRGTDHKRQSIAPSVGAALKRTQAPGMGAPSMRSHGQNLETETNYDVISMADRSEGIYRRNLQYENTYKMEPDVRFMAGCVEKEAEDVLTERLKDMKYDPATCKHLSQELAGIIMERVKLFAFKRYKFVVVVSIGSLKERPGMQFGSRCLWNKGTDSFANVKFANGSLFAVAMIYGLYYE
ncbi:tctex1 domain-containing protein 1-B [Lingula anatina]|uniref:Tctex1 domain-containing protein 1-B n=1 Tax=Lingula anatina TaxID=7574 RepID=A0A1S3JDJ0_LINAN|nr:tctex1 domain-containing protein 1-B [Lingula anatina]|eukprot:XP_013408480.1 tctex1 domain-containing protein 1-B [Lingula anatina]